MSSLQIANDALSSAPQAVLLNSQLSSCLQGRTACMLQHHLCSQSSPANYCACSNATVILPPFPMRPLKCDNPFSMTFKNHHKPLAFISLLSSRHEKNRCCTAFFKQCLQQRAKHKSLMQPRLSTQWVPFSKFCCF